MGGIPTEHLPTHISVSDPANLSFWCQHLGCSREELFEALEKIGNCTSEVKLYLQKRTTNPNGFKFWKGMMES